MCLIKGVVWCDQGKSCPVEAWCSVLSLCQCWAQLLSRWEQCPVHQESLMDHDAGEVEPVWKGSVCEWLQVKVASLLEWRGGAEAVLVSF